jgi:hypothetical protein
MKTCKTGCGKMKTGGTVKKIKKMATGGSTGLVGMPRYSNNPRSEQGRILKKGGSSSSNSCPKGYHWDGQLCTKNMFNSLSSKLGVGTVLAGAVGTGLKAISDKVKAKKEEQKKKSMLKDAATTKAKFGATVNVQRGYPGKIRSAGDQGYTAIGNREPARTKFAKGGFPDLNKDGKITKADILKGRGVIKKKGGAVKKK